MNDNGWSLTSMIIFCSILLVGFFASMVIARKNFKDLFDDVETIDLSNSIDNVILNSAHDDKVEEDIDYSVYENEIKSAAKAYIKDKNDDSKIISIDNLIKYNYIKEIHDPKQYESICKGYIIHNNSKYYPYLRCIGSYATEGYNLDYEN